MKIIKAELLSGKTVTQKESLSFPKEIFNGNHVRDIQECEVEISSTMYDDFVDTKIAIKAKVVAACSYTLEDVVLPLNIKDELIFSEYDDGENYYEPGPFVELDDYILGLILANVPIKVTKKGAKLPESGESYRVLSEDMLEQERKNKKDERWDVLNQLDLDE